MKADQILSSSVQRVRRILMVQGMVVGLIVGGVAMPVQAQPLPVQPPPGRVIDPRIRPAGPAPRIVDVSLTQTTATLTWTAVPGASGYEVYRAKGAGAAAGVGGVIVTPAPTQSTTAK